jgi:hypothetical protein
MGAMGLGPGAAPRRLFSAIGQRVPLCARNGGAGAVSPRSGWLRGKSWQKRNVGSGIRWLLGGGRHGAGVFAR